MDPISLPAVVAAHDEPAHHTLNSWAKEADWNGHRARISSLYAKHSLAEVMRIMEVQHSFRATMRMYKNRIAKWGLDKNRREPEMRTIICKQIERARQGRASQFKIRGKTVDYQEAARFFERKGLSISDVVTRWGTEPALEMVRCCTPLIPSMEMPETLATPEKIFKVIRDYCRESFDTGQWARTDQQIDCYTTKCPSDASSQLNAFYESYVTGCQLFSINAPMEAGETLRSAATNSDDIISAEHPYLLKTLLDLVLYSGRHGKRDVAVVVMKHFFELGEIKLGEQHPLRSVCGWLAALDPAQMEDIIFKCFRVLRDHFVHTLGPMHRSTLRLQCDYIRFGGYASNPEREGVVLRGTLDTCADALGLYDPRTMRVRLELAIYFLAKGRCCEALTTAQEIIDQAELAQQVSCSDHFRVEGLYQLAVTQNKLGNTACAKKNLSTAADLAILHFGKQEARVKNWLVLLEKWFRVQGQPVEAEQVRKKREFMAKTDT